MENFDRKKHWETIYRTKELKDVSWFQPTPTTSLQFIEESGISKTSKIIDIGGGDSFLVDFLLERNYTDITVLDISDAALQRAKQRLGANAQKVKWIVADAANFTPSEKYDVWHDRAAFHFLTNENEIAKYVETLKGALNNNGLFIIGTFSDQGPKKCSGIEIKQYSGQSISTLFLQEFEKIKCVTTDHLTPSNTIQNFLFCSFRRQG